MSKDAVDKLKDRMAKASTTDSKAKASPAPPADGGSMGTGRDGDIRGKGSKDKDVSSGPKSLAEKQAVAEEKVNIAKASDTEDMREETSGDERFDLVTGKELNIPPSIIAERLRLGQNPGTGEPWTREERMRYDRDQEQARQRHAKAVKESEMRMRQDQSEAQIQPTPHVPISQLTAGQKKAMQKAQDEGKGPIAQAVARDQNSPEEIGRREAQASEMTEQDKRRDEAGVDEDIEREELEKGDDQEEDQKDADEVQRDLDEKRNRG